MISENWKSAAGLMPTTYKSNHQIIASNKSISIEGVGGFLCIQNLYNSSGWDVWFCTKSQAARLISATYNTNILVTMSGNTATIKNANTIDNYIEIYYQTNTF